jgi:RecA/RadA recombinase
MIFESGPMAKALVFVGEKLKLTVQVHVFEDADVDTAELRSMGVQLKTWPSGTKPSLVKSYFKAMARHHSDWWLNDDDPELIAKLIEGIVEEINSQFAMLDMTPEYLVLSQPFTTFQKSVIASLAKRLPKINIICVDSIYFSHGADEGLHDHKDISYSVKADSNETGR